MRITVERQLPFERARVFDALIDPEVLRGSIPGCESLVPTGPDAYAATLKIGVAGLKGTYGGTAAIRDKRPTESLTLTFEGKGSPGFVRGSAAIALAEQDGGTRVSCEADVQVGGLIAAVGSRLVEAMAKKLADDFFGRLSQQLQGRSEDRPLQMPPIPNP